MKRTPFALATLVAGLALGVPALPAVAGDEATAAALLEAKAPTVVTVKFVVKMRHPQMGDQETNADARGVVVDPSGLVMLGNDSLEPGGGMLRMMMRRRGGGGSDLVTTPMDFKVLFGSDAKEHDAVLVARDSNLGLAFVQIVAPEGALAAADLAAGVEPKVGATLFGVSRRSRGFDAAPVLGRVFVSGRVDKPRPMWSLDDASGGLVGLPLYDAAGKLVGVPVQQRGVEGADEGGMFGGQDMGLFLLPLDAVSRSVEQAKKRVPEAVEKAKAAKADADAPKPEAPTTAPEAPKAPEPPKAPEAPKAPESPK